MLCFDSNISSVLQNAIVEIDHKNALKFGENLSVSKSKNAHMVKREKEIRPHHDIAN